MKITSSIFITFALLLGYTYGAPSYLRRHVQTVTEADSRIEGIRDVEEEGHKITLLSNSDITTQENTKALFQNGPPGPVGNWNGNNGPPGPSGNGPHRSLEGVVPVPTTEKGEEGGQQQQLAEDPTKMIWVPYPVQPAVQPWLGNNHNLPSPPF